MIHAITFFLFTKLSQRDTLFLILIYMGMKNVIVSYWSMNSYSRIKNPRLVQTEKVKLNEDYINKTYLGL